MVMGSDEEEEERTLMAAGGGGGSSSSSRCEWHPATVSCLLDSYGLKCGHIKGYLKIRDWEDIVRDVNAHHYYEGGAARSAAPKTMKQCRDKVENLKRRYKVEKRRSDARSAWSFFPKLDHIMTSLSKSATLVDSPQDDVDLDVDVDADHSFDCFAGESAPLPLMGDVVLSAFVDRPKPLDHVVDCSLDDILNTVGYNRASSRLDFQDSSSPDKKPPKRKKPSSTSSSSPFSKKRRAASKPPLPTSSNPVQALADALVGFSEVYARIEIAKMEMLTKLVLELSKTHSKRRKKPHAASAPADPK